eukprot:364285-Chlamydomonas_euryale.AAC.2
MRGTRQTCRPSSGWHSRGRACSARPWSGSNKSRTGTAPCPLAAQSARVCEHPRTHACVRGHGTEPSRWPSWAVAMGPWWCGSLVVGGFGDGGLCGGQGGYGAVLRAQLQGVDHLRVG